MGPVEVILSHNEIRSLPRLLTGCRGLSGDRAPALRLPLSIDPESFLQLLMTQRPTAILVQDIEPSVQPFHPFGDLLPRQLTISVTIKTGDDTPQ
jgi:hypothetical protein